ncbi:secreted seminal-vesicle Ly-6 protein 1-like [Lacerta agilis]|uniref:secreted seminal-vesicle Ly-6 protein 1-like n=1 Tax=Lacerta agilis TaxID=80427 RepID=UPI00141A64DA|nr:secreted seminal-vesicle Ly-6 protein 1-like [Lacerta agilis]
MNSLLYLGFCLLLSVEIVVSIKCAHCQFQHSKGTCLERKRPCRLYVGKSCYKQAVYFGKTLLFSMKGCSTQCVNVQEKPAENTITQTFRCCSNKSFCNL